MDANIAVPSLKQDAAIFADPRVVDNILQLATKYQPSATYFDEVQVQVDPSMRRILLNWMSEVVEEQCGREVFFLAVNYVDRFLSTMCISRFGLQAFGAAAMFVASKLREPRPMTSDTLVNYTDNSIGLDELYEKEVLLVATLKWDMAAVTPFDILVQIVARLPFDESVRSRLQATAEVALTRFTLGLEYLRQSPTMVAACSLLIAIEAIHCDAQAEVEANQVASYHPASASASHCVGCAMLAIISDDNVETRRQCCFEQVYMTVLQIACDLLHTAKEQIAECKFALLNSVNDEAGEVHDEVSAFSPDDVQDDDDAEAADDDDHVPTSSQTQSEVRSSAMMNQDEDSLMSQSDIEMANMAEMNNNEPEHDRLLVAKSLDDSGYIADLSPSSRKFASTPTGGDMLLAF